MSTTYSMIRFMFEDNCQFIITHNVFLVPFYPFFFCSGTYFTYYAFFIDKMKKKSQDTDLFNKVLIIMILNHIFFYFHLQETTKFDFRSWLIKKDTFMIHLFFFYSSWKFTALPSLF